VSTRNPEFPLRPPAAYPWQRRTPRTSRPCPFIGCAAQRVYSHFLAASDQRAHEILWAHRVECAHLRRRRRGMLAGEVACAMLIVLIIVLLLVGYGGYSAGPGWGYAGGGIGGLLILIIILWLLFGGGGLGHRW
jgi:hypothetical protein